jgi:[heparan sulfate]-glucosamine 3-sulfotransferase 5
MRESKISFSPQVEKSPLEIHFFDRDENYIKGLEWYASQMPETVPSQIAIEKSPSYFVTPEVPERIYEMNSSVKLLLIVREPVTRVISDYTQIYLQSPTPLNANSTMNTTITASTASVQIQQPSLEELVLTPSGHVNTNYKAIRISMYSRYMRRWLDVFPKEQIHVIDGDALIRDPYNVLFHVEKFLGLEHKLERDNFYFNNTKGFYCWRSLNKMIHFLNDSKGRRHPVVKVGLIRTLREFYRRVNYEFYEMVGRDFGWPEH